MKQREVNGVLCTRYLDGAVTIFKKGDKNININHNAGLEADKAWLKFTKGKG